jgi:hypothetical protein
MPLHYRSEHRAPVLVAVGCQKRGPRARESGSMSYREDLVFSSHKALARWLLSESETGANKLIIHEACQNQYGENSGGESIFKKVIRETSLPDIQSHNSG